MASLNVLGLNSGTSIDGIDIAHCKITSPPKTCDITINLLSYTEVPINSELRARVLALTRPDAPTTLADICDLNFALGEEFTRTVVQSDIEISDVDIIASHGQTLWHAPDEERKSTLQMGEAAVIANATRKTVVSDFRVAEIAAGRQGAPLSGILEAGLLCHPRLTRVSQNIGGIGNATAVPATGSVICETLGSNRIEFDTGPGNVLIDAAVRILSNGREHYDKDGEAGTRGEGEINHATVDKFLASPYFNRPPPKTTGRELFSDDVARDLVTQLQNAGSSNDAIIATITRITSESIARAYESFIIPVLGPIHEIYLCGGGAYNPNISKHLASQFPAAKICCLDEAGLGIRAEAKEAVLFALLGFLAVCGQKSPVSGLAENKKEVVLGNITPGENFGSVMRRVMSEGAFEGGGLGRVRMKVGK